MRIVTLYLGFSCLALFCWSVPAVLGQENGQPVFLAPIAESPRIGVIPPGVDPVVAEPGSDPRARVPSGWKAVLFTNTFTGFVRNEDIGKNLNVLSGSLVYMQPSLDSFILTILEDDDVATLDDVIGDWSRVRLRKTLLAYLQDTAPAVAPSPTRPVRPPAPAATPAPAPSPPPVAPPAPPAQVQPRPSIPDATTVDAPATPLYFEGFLAPVPRRLVNRPPYTFQLVDERGRRIGFLDVSRLVPMEPIENFIDRPVMLRGRAAYEEEWRALVITVETLRLRR